MDVRVIEMARISVPTGRLRPLNEDNVAQLAASMAEQGLINPITVRATGSTFELVAGAHRYAAGKRIGLVDIPAVVAVLDDLGARLREIDENLVRHDMTKLERAEHLAERKRVYLLQHPETKQGTAGAIASNSAQGRGGATATVAVAPPSFVTETQAQTGIAERTIHQAVQIAESIPEDVRMHLHGTPVAASTTMLTAIAGLDHEAQRDLVGSTDLTDAASVRVAVAARSTPRPLRASSSPRPSKRGGKPSGAPRAVVPPRPESVVRFVYVVGALHQLLEIDLSDLLGHLTTAEIDAYRGIRPSLGERLRALDDLFLRAERAI